MNTEKQLKKQPTMWNNDSVTKFLEGNKSYGSFIDGKISCIKYSLENVDFLIYRNDTTVELYFPAPYSPKNDYSYVESFFEECKPVLSKIVNAASDERLLK